MLNEKTLKLFNKYTFFSDKKGNEKIGLLNKQVLIVQNKISIENELLDKKVYDKFNNLYVELLKTLFTITAKEYFTLKISKPNDLLKKIKKLSVEGADFLSVNNEKTYISYNAMFNNLQSGIKNLYTNGVCGDKKVYLEIKYLIILLEIIKDLPEIEFRFNIIDGVDNKEKVFSPLIYNNNEMNTTIVLSVARSYK